MKTQLIIARHGNTFAAGEPVRRVGATDLPLVDSGRSQGSLLGHYLKQQHLVPDVIFTSKLQRTIQTAELAQQAMGTDLSIETLSLFNEIDYGPDENQLEELVVARIGKAALYDWETQGIVPQGWKVDPKQLIDNWMGFAASIQSQYAGKTCLIVTSNGIARFAPYLTGDFAKFSTKHRIKIATGAFSIFTNQQRSNQWDCIAWNVTPDLTIGVQK